MKNVPENELFSAYLDGEATAEEQSQVEQLLASSPEARRMLDQMRALSVALQSLPGEKSPEDLASRVLKSAEQRMLSEPADAPSAVAASAAAKARSFLRRLTRPRVLFWTAATILVAVGLSLYGPKTSTGPTGRGDLARNETESSSGAGQRTPSGTVSIGPAPSVPPTTSVVQGSRIGVKPEAGPLPTPSAVHPIPPVAPVAPDATKSPAPADTEKTTAAKPADLAVSIVTCELRGDALDTSVLADVLDKLRIAWPRPDATAAKAATELRVRIPLSLVERTMVIARLQKQSERVASVTLTPDASPRPTDVRFPVDFVLRKGAKTVPSPSGESTKPAPAPRAAKP